MTDESTNPMRDAIQSAISENQVILFMKGTPEQPACGFSARTVAILQSLQAPFAAVDILPELRELAGDAVNLPDGGTVTFELCGESVSIRFAQRHLIDLERERAVQQEDLAAAFQDLKSFELAEQERLRRASEAEGKAAQSRLDEMAMTRHLRKHAGRQA